MLPYMPATFAISMTDKLSAIKTQQNLSTMNQSIVISPRVINAIQSMPYEDRIAIVSALAGELILGQSPEGQLSPLETMLYQMILSYVRHDSQMLA